MQIVDAVKASCPGSGAIPAVASLADSRASVASVASLAAAESEEPFGVDGVYQPN